MKRKSVISGANSGIGFQTALALAAQGDHLILICRNKSRASEAKARIISAHSNAKVDIFICDLSEQHSIRQVGIKLRDQFNSIDVLVNNAGGVFGEHRFTSDSIEHTFALNHLGYFLLTHELMPLLLAADKPRVVNVASLAHRNAQFDYEGLNPRKANYNSWKAYSLSKLCNILFTKKLAEIYSNTGLTTNALHPGVVATNFGNGGPSWVKFLIKLPFSKWFMIDDKKGAETSIFLATSDQVAETTGQYFAKSRQKQSSAAARNQENIDSLWDASLKLTYVETFGEPVAP